MDIKPLSFEDVLAKNRYIEVILGTVIPTHVGLTHKSRKNQTAEAQSTGRNETLKRILRNPCDYLKVY